MNRRLAAAAAAAIGLAAVMALAAAVIRPPAAGAAYGYVAEGFAQWEWARSQSDREFQIADAVDRGDGWLIVATGEAYDGWLHLLPPWGGVVDKINRFGAKPLNARQLEMRGGRLYALAHEGGTERRSAATLYELDAMTGAVQRTLGDWWNEDLAVDPVTGDLVLQTWMADSPLAHDLVAFDPDSGRSRVLIPDTEPQSDTAMEVAFSPDGSLLLVGHPTGTSLQVRRRDGGLLHEITIGTPLEGLLHGAPGTCFEGMAVFTRVDGTVWGVGLEPNSNPVTLAAAGRAAAASFAAVDHRGLVITSRLSEVTLLACAGFKPPVPPSGVPPVVREAGATPPPVGRTPQTPAVVQPAPPSQPPSPPLAGPSPPAAIGVQQAVAQGIAPQAALSDAEQEEHEIVLNASARLGVGAVVTLALALASFAVLQERDDAERVDSAAAARSPVRGWWR